MNMVRLLLVEDNEQVWDFLSRRLQKRGYEVLLAHDGEAGLAAARASQPDVVLLDMNLPVMDGWTVARSLRADPQAAHLKIIAMTAHAMAGDREKTLEAGCNDYHPKPIDFPKLLAQIDALITPTAANGPT
jgi:two-component system, cell cycle response regulator DivK